MDLLAMMYARYIISGDRKYSQTPRQLKTQVAEILREQGMEHLITED